jgi:hypothetical protein
MKNEYESLEQLIEILEEIKALGEGSFSFPQAIYLLSKEIKKLKDKVEGEL